MNQNIAKKLNHYHCCDNLFECLNSEFKAIKFNKQFHYYYIVLHGLYSDSEADEKNLELNMSSIEYVKLHLLNPNQLNTEKKKNLELNSNKSTSLSIYKNVAQPSPATGKLFTSEAMVNRNLSNSSNEVEADAQLEVDSKKIEKIVAENNSASSLPVAFASLEVEPQSFPTINFILNYCPFCGVKLEIFDDFFYEDLKKEGYDYDEIAEQTEKIHELLIKKGKISNSFAAPIEEVFQEKIPDKFKSDAWWVEARYSKYITNNFSL